VIGDPEEKAEKPPRSRHFVHPYLPIILRNDKKSQLPIAKRGGKQKTDTDAHFIRKTSEEAACMREKLPKISP
jgi:hypothetical protein